VALRTSNITVESFRFIYSVCSRPKFAVAKMHRRSQNLLLECLADGELSWPTNVQSFCREVQVHLISSYRPNFAEKEAELKALGASVVLTEERAQSPEGKQIMVRALGAFRFVLGFNVFSEERKKPKMVKRGI
jgi:hypothetical protein